jgi:hypothetical protein
MVRRTPALMSEWTFAMRQFRRRNDESIATERQQACECHGEQITDLGGDSPA